MAKLVYLLEPSLSHGPFHFCLAVLMNGELGHMSPQTTVRLELYFFRKKEYCVSIEILKSKSLQALRLHVVSTFRVVLGNGIDYLVTVYIGLKIKRLLTLFPSDVYISVYCRHQ